MMADFLKKCEGSERRRETYSICRRPTTSNGTYGTSKQPTPGPLTHDPNLAKKLADSHEFDKITYMFRDLIVKVLNF